MRTTKALLCAAAVAAGAVSAMAQSSNVYSLNVVGYINVSLTNTWTMVANHLDLDGNMTNNTVQSVFSTNLPNNSQVYVFQPGSGYVNATYLSGKWIGNTNAANAALTPGKGVFLKKGGTGAANITMVGNVVQGTNVIGIVPGFQIVSSVPPVSGGLKTVLGYVPTKNDQILLYNGTYSTKTWLGSSWIGGEPVPDVGQAFWLKAVGATNWTQGFTVQ